MVDTGSELTWIQCQGAISSFPQQQPLYPATNSSTYQPLRCNKRRKGSSQNLDCYRGLCDDQGMCIYEKSYEDGTVTSGKLAKEKFTVNSDNHVLESFIIVMGCALNQVNFVSGSHLEVFSGYLGLSGGSKSLLKQLNLGEVRQAYRTGLYDHGTGHYYLVLEDIGVHGSSVVFQRGDFEYKEDTRRGGCLIDSGTAVTFMRGSHFGRAAKKAKKLAELDPVIPSPFNSLELCFPRYHKRFEYPTITYHFLNADFELKKDQSDTAFAITENYVCLGLIRAPGNDPYDVMFGAMQQARKRILHDVTGGISFSCSFFKSRIILDSLTGLVVSYSVDFVSSGIGYCHSQSYGPCRASNKRKTYKSYICRGFSYKNHVPMLHTAPMLYPGVLQRHIIERICAGKLGLSQLSVVWSLGVICSTWHILRMIQVQMFLAWDYSAWDSTYALYLEEGLECFRVLKHEIETDPPGY
ncbi:hypothetical protein MKW98_021127 [Papaver atlanticum]|uniref:Peptidase A1 domain-containing protein n=1 Tax=Papaver atlanticum TaxID=357466 RepID=A0AAD4XTZ7_9MAGN|nr:hypothetical protein MKW98_021127 [Papaver atlanticum]